MQYIDQFFSVLVGQGVRCDIVKDGDLRIDIDDVFFYGNFVYFVVKMRLLV